MSDDLETVLAQIQARQVKLDPPAFFAKVDEYRRGSLPAQTLRDGPRAADKPMPALDAVDHQLLAVTDQYRHLMAATATAENLRKAEALERGIRGVLGEDVHGPDGDAAMRRARRKANEILRGDEDRGGRTFDCRWCEEKFGITATVRPRGGLCPKCDQLKRRNPEWDALPESVKAKRVARMLRGQQESGPA